MLPHQFLWVSFLRTYSPGGILNMLATTLHGSSRTTPSIHRLCLGLLGSLIPFAPLAFVSAEWFHWLRTRNNLFRTVSRLMLFCERTPDPTLLTPFCEPKQMKVEFSMTVCNLVIIVEDFTSVLGYVSFDFWKKITDSCLIRDCFGALQSTWVERDWEFRMDD
jgi:hypothetical protein